MKRRKRTEILIKSCIEVARSLVQDLEEKYQIKTVEEPNYGLVMIKHREGAKRSQFYLGEILVTEAKVQINNSLGLGIVAGYQEERAYLLAVIDAAYKADLPETKLWDDILTKTESYLQEEKQKYEAKILMTKVNFETMDV